MIELEQILSNKEQVISASPLRHSPLQRVTQTLSKRNLAAARAELLNEALTQLVALCYEVEAGQPWNVDPQTGRILVPVPMGGRGYRQWGISRLERDILRRLLIAHQEARDVPPLFLYDGLSNAWLLNLWDYGSDQQARHWLKQNRATAQQWLGHYMAHIKADRARREG